MNRRQFASNVVGLGGGLVLASRARPQAPTPDPLVRRVLAMFKCHLDVGFVDTQAAIIQKYFRQYFPKAIQIAGSMRASGPDHYTWTTGSWLLYEYLEQASAAERKRMENAITSGDIAWHALPFTWQTELLDPSVITAAIGFSKSLDSRFGRKTTGAKMTDVPGHTRGLVAPLAESGVAFLDIGVNSASTPPDVPELFVWKAPDGAELVMMYHRLAYGGVVRIPDSDVAVAVEMADDNRGPHSPEEIRAIYKDLRAQFPNAAIQASSLTDIANAVVPHRAKFPVITQEIGDTWIYGIASDPVKLARFREVLRLRGEWLANGKLKASDKTDLAFLSRFLLGAEHTWGTDTKTWLDFEHYTPEELAAKLNDPKYKVVTNSWVEKRADLDQGIASLPAPLKQEALRRVAALTPARPDVSGLREHKPEEPFETDHFVVRLDPATGAITQFRSKAGDRDWASADMPLGLVSYQTLSKADYDKFLASYITVQTDWAPKDFGKPEIDRHGARSSIRQARLMQCLSGRDRIVNRLALEGAGAPSEVFIEMFFPASRPRVELTVSWFGKKANRLPEALWFSMKPVAPAPGKWLLAKTGGTVAPDDVISGGNRHMHAVSNGLTYDDGRGRLAIGTMDAALVVLGEMSPIYFSNTQPNPSAGIHFSLFNNGWGTNYVQWFGEDMRFRFSIDV